MGSTMIAVCVTFTIKPGMIGDFMGPMLQNARASVDKETGCHRFDVCTDEVDPQTVFLYELYSDHDAFAEHQQTDHFLEFNTVAADMIAEKEVRVFGSVAEGA